MRSIRAGDLCQHGAGELVLRPGYDDSSHQARRRPGHQALLGTPRARPGKRLACRCRIWPPARHHGDRERVPVHVQAHCGSRAQAMRLVFTLTGNVPRRVLRPELNHRRNQIIPAAPQNIRPHQRQSRHRSSATRSRHPRPIALTGLSVCAGRSWPMPGRGPGDGLPWRLPGLGRETVMDSSDEP